MSIQTGRTRRHSLLLASIAIPLAVIGSSAHAQEAGSATSTGPATGSTAGPVTPAIGGGTTTAATAQPADGGADPGEILVTARKNSEDILKTPIAISAFTSTDLAARGVVSLQDISAFTPGLKIVNNSSGRNDRSFQQIIIRGFTPSNSLSQTTSVFIEGVPVSSATAISNITDPERVEILKGPQSAYFGRQTFAGAFNVVTKLPPETLGGSISGLVGTRDNYDIQADIGGPLIGDVLGFRATARKFAKNGSYRNAGRPEQTLGDQSTKSGTLALVFKPTDNFTARAFGLLTANDDGPSAQGLISAYTVTNAAGGVVLQGQSNCTLNGLTNRGVARTNAYICGKTPGLINSPSANTLNDSYIKNFLANPRGRIIDPEDGPDGYGLKSRYYHLHLAMDWELPDTGVTLTSLTGFNRERYSQLADLDNYYDTTVANAPAAVAAGARSYFDFPFLVERTNHDFSQEVRAAYDDKGPFRLTVGASYLNNRTESALGGGSGALGITTFVVPQGIGRARTLGAFFGLGYDVAPGLTINVDGRYQIDKLYAYAARQGVTLTSDVFAPAGFYPGGSTLLKRSYKNFMPRVIVNYDITPRTMVYASYSKGINPGGFNTGFLTATPAVARAAEAAGLQIGVRPEKLDNYEVGVKGRLLDNHIRYAVSAYYGIWNDQLNTQTLALLDPDTNLPQIVQSTANTGKVKVKGIEADVTAFVTERLTLNLSGAVNDTKIIRLVFPTTTQLTGIIDFRGKENPLTSKYSGVASAQYTAPLPGLADAEGYGRIDYTYKSGVYSNAANILKTPDIHTVNVRLGVKNDKVTLEGFITNLFNNRAYTSVVDANAFSSNFAYTTYISAVNVGLPELRTFGLRAKYAF